MSGASTPEFVTLARIFKPRGNKGEAAARDLCEDPDRFEDGTQVTLLYPTKRREQRKIEHSWYHQGRLILKFEGVDSISDAEELRGCEVQIPYVDLGPAPEGENYDVDLIGCEVIAVDSGRVIGQVEGLLEPGGQTLLEVRQGKKEVLIPYTPEICLTTDVANKRITVQLPEGLEELNG